MQHGVALVLWVTSNLSEDQGIYNKTFYQGGSNFGFLRKVNLV